MTSREDTANSHNQRKVSEPTVWTSMLDLRSHPNNCLGKILALEIYSKRSEIFVNQLNSQGYREVESF